MGGMSYGSTMSEYRTDVIVGAVRARVNDSGQSVAADAGA